MTSRLEIRRKQLIAELRNARIADEQVLAAMDTIPREHFVDARFRKFAYSDRALPIAMGQTISQPLMVAVMTQALALTGTERVLEIGTGSGYQTAILARLASHVYSIERYQQLAVSAARRLEQLAIDNISLYIADGSLGWPNEAPYDCILVTAAAPNIPSHLLEQLTLSGRLVIPVGNHKRQDLQVAQRETQGIRVQSLGYCVFVPLVGEAGWHE
ncbi:MAG: protein-L-isoaspartate(D-aspartate) O-methyltransferase [Ktedonobacteraceae bacterium]|nr:protein-L-isoaspartate(D-aspartate) O-methyltransferase [Ktedonobacteraceae bacterium]